MNTDKITKRDKQDFWIQNHPKEVNKLMKKKTTMLNNGSISQEQYDKQLHSKITETQLNSLSKHDLQVLAIYREMSAGSHLMQMIKMKMLVKRNMLLFLNNWIIYLVSILQWIGIENIHMVKL